MLVKITLNYFLSNHTHTHSHRSRSVVSDFATPWIVAHQAPLSMGFSRHEYWSGLPFPFPTTLLIKYESAYFPRFLTPDVSHTLNLC